MRTRKTKDEFVAEMRKRIEIRNMLNEFYINVYLPMMCTKFDGKVYNKRFLNALNTEAKKIHEWLYVAEKYGEIVFELRLSNCNYNDYESFMCKCVCKEGRISYDATINDAMNTAWVENFNKYTEEIQSAIDNYDEYLKIADELEEAVKKYNELPSRFRGNIDIDYMRIY